MADIDAIRLMALCLAAAMICAILRPQRPELAMAVSLGAGVAVLAALALALREAAPRYSAVLSLFSGAEDTARDAALKAAGIAILAELGEQICEDAGENSMAGRIALVSRVAILSLCLPLAADILDSISGMFS